MSYRYSSVRAALVVLISNVYIRAPVGVDIAGQIDRQLVLGAGDRIPDQ